MSNGEPGVGRTISLCMDIRGGIRHLNGLRKNAPSCMIDDDGKPLSKVEAIAALTIELIKGRHVLPMGRHCAKPCAYASCPGFDYGEHGGCGGHISNEEPKQKEKMK